MVTIIQINRFTQHNKMVRFFSCLILTFGFCASTVLAPGPLGGACSPRCPSVPSYINNPEDVKQYCLTALTQRFGEIKDMITLTGMSTCESFSDFVWCQVRDGEGQLFSIYGSNSTGVTLTVICPENQSDLYFTEFTLHNGFLQLRSKNPENASEIFCWEFDYTNWKSISEDDWLYYPEQREKQIQTLYPGHACNIISDSKGNVLAFLVDPLDVGVERAIVFRRLWATDCEQTELFRAKADSIKADGMFVRYQGLDGHSYAKKINLENMTLQEALPVHPLELHWHELAFSNAGNLLFARHTLPATLVAQYWIIQNGDWKIIHEGLFPAQSLRVNGADQVYRFSYADTGLTMEWLNLEYVFESTNVNDFPIQLICGSFTASTKNPCEILALQDYSAGSFFWRFPPSSVLTLQAEYDSLLEDLRRQWKSQGKHYADRTLSVESFHLNEENNFDKMFVSFPENSLLQFYAEIHSFSPTIYLLGNEDQFHQPLQIYSVDVEGHAVPYFYVPPVDGLSNGKTLVMMDGGPEGAYTGGYSLFIKTFTQAGWAVIIPQESLRTGHGWSHYFKGIGEMGRKNLHQLLHIFHDAIHKHLIEKPEQTHLYGCSYGGFVAASFALRWDFLHEQAGLPKLFNFQSIVAQAAYVDNDSSPWANRETIVGTTDPKIFYNSFMPVNLVNGQLSAPFSMVHGKVDIRCSANDIRTFASALTSAGNPFRMFWYNGGHNLPFNECYLKFLLALMEGCQIDNTLTEVGFTQEM